MGRRRLLEFKSERELVRFLDDPKLDLSTYDLQTIGEPVSVEVDADSLRLQEEAEYGKGGKLRPITMRLDEKLVIALKQIASRRSMSYQTLARMWLRERTIEELRSKAAYSMGTEGSTSSQGVREQARVEQLLSQVDARLDEVRGLLQDKGYPRPRRAPENGEGAMSKVVEKLKASKHYVDELELPDTAGAYAMFLADEAALPGFEVPEERPIYIGVSSNLAGRLLGNHFDSTKTGWSTVRRSLGAILKERLHLSARPRGQEREEEDYGNYRFEPEDEVRLTDWMRKHIMVGAQNGEELMGTEGELIRYARPLLNLTKWENPDALRIKGLREVCADEARRFGGRKTTQRIPRRT